MDKVTVRYVYHMFLQTTTTCIHEQLFIIISRLQGVSLFLTLHFMPFCCYGFFRLLSFVLTPHGLERTSMLYDTRPFAPGRRIFTVILLCKFSD